jgi:hypothetical protein
MTFSTRKDCHFIALCLCFFSLGFQISPLRPLFSQRLGENLREDGLIGFEVALQQGTLVLGAV